MGRTRVPHEVVEVDPRDLERSKAQTTPILGTRWLPDVLPHNLASSGEAARDADNLMHHPPHPQQPIEIRQNSTLQVP